MGEMLWLQKWISEVDDLDGERLSAERAVARVHLSITGTGVEGL